MIKKEEGITLIALVITIIVLLILAGITLGSISDHNGVIEQSKETVQNAQRESIIEKIEADLYSEKTKTGKEQSKTVLKNIIVDNNYGTINEDDDSFTTKEGNYKINFSEIAGWEKAYKQLAYLESTGTQWIDTNILATKSTTLNIDFQFNKIESYKSLFGCVIAYKLDSRFYFNTVEYFQIGYGGAGLVNVMPADTSRHTLIFNDITSSSNFCLGDLTYSIPSSNYAENGLSIMLFTQHNSRESDTESSACSAKIYSCKIYDNNTLVRDYIPVLDPDRIPCMYDKIEGKYYYNQGTGEFLYDE